MVNPIHFCKNCGARVCEACDKQDKKRLQVDKNEFSFIRAWRLSGHKSQSCIDNYDVNAWESM